MPPAATAVLGMIAGMVLAEVALAAAAEARTRPQRPAHSADAAPVAADA